MVIGDPEESIVADGREPPQAEMGSIAQQQRPGHRFRETQPQAVAGVDFGRNAAAGPSAGVWRGDGVSLGRIFEPDDFLRASRRPHAIKRLAVRERSLRSKC